MKALLMSRREDFDLARPAPWNEAALIRDLGLDVLFAAMAQGDKLLAAVARQAVLAGTADVETIRYRQAVLRDCLAHREPVRRIYDIASEAIERERKDYFGKSTRYPAAVLSRSMRILKVFLALLADLRKIAERDGDAFASEGFRRFFAMLRDELNPAFFAEVEQHLKRLRFRDGVLLGAGLGKGLKGADYVLREPKEERWRWIRRLLARREERRMTVYIHPRDQAGARALADLRGRGIRPVAGALAQSVDHILDFFAMVQAELAFYLGCANLHDALAAKGVPISFPVPRPPGGGEFSCTGLCDASLALCLNRPVVGNDVNGDGRRAVIVTGANQGGKSTFLRSVGEAQLMMQCGMFVAAGGFRAAVCDGLFTHFKREEDAAMESGKFDEELKRMSAIVDHATGHALFLFNESFAATNEREGSEIARQIVRALVDRGKRVFFVTHLYDFAHRLHEGEGDGALFLRADRLADGRRPFKLVEGRPLPTSFGRDLYRRIFAGAPPGAGARESLSGSSPIT